MRFNNNERKNEQKYLDCDLELLYTLFFLSFHTIAFKGRRKKKKVEQI